MKSSQLFLCEQACFSHRLPATPILFLPIFCLSLCFLSAILLTYLIWYVILDAILYMDNFGNFHMPFNGDGI